MGLPSANSNRSVYNLKSYFTITFISGLYLLLSYFLIGFKTEQLVLVLLFAGLYFISAPTRKLIMGFSIFIVYWIIFDYMKAFPNYRYHSVHIASLYSAEKNIFGVSINGSLLTPNEYWLLHKTVFLDIMSGCFYLTWVPVPLMFAVYLFYKKREQFFYFSFTFLLVNLIGFVIYYLYPAAPPWYVQLHGFSFDPHTMGNTAGLSRFDAYFNSGIFKSIYAKSSNVFAAMPSLHSSYPVIVLYFGLKNKMGVINVLFALIMMGIWFSAVYASHHYVLDVLAGIICALVGIFFFQKILLQNKLIQQLLEKMRTATA